MAFASAITKQTVMGNMRVTMGTYGQESGDVGGAVVTGLEAIDCFQISAEVTNVSVSGGTATVTTEDPVATVVGYWLAFGS